MPLARTPNLKRLVLLVWVLAAIFYFYLSYDYIRVTMGDREFAEYLHHLVQLAAVERRTSKDIRDLLLVKATQLSLPVEREQIEVKGSGDSLDIAVNYSVDIEIPLIRQEIYSKKFNHRVKYQPPN